MIKLRNATKYYEVKGGRNYLFRDVTLDIPSGKNIGILGRNGAGKSTLLRILGGIDYPSSGSVEVPHNISWPVGIVGGAQGSLTARENARFVCRLYSLGSVEIQEKISFVEEFSELGRYMDMPIKTYSSGMKSRFKFALSMAFDFDYYIMDEVLSVGDQFFKSKCEQKINEIRDTRNILLVSHGLGQLKRLCDCGILIQDKEVYYFEDINAAVAVYQGKKCVKGHEHAQSA
ncbi:ABC transporter ATP-binding protein [Desulfoluna spongiiphila]|uniref:ABC transporter ATP-binding protein n=1 Tax=Desulfoluna spongiiphila TaxID=419481 RepID=UPI0012519A20|nr:ABC transporter ATP-binding protein [Desulfoluna spongiiphila]VVS92365.1 abc transporter-like [Desulfoluna spongiiphila]